MMISDLYDSADHSMDEQKFNRGKDSVWNYFKSCVSYPVFPGYSHLPYLQFFVFYTIKNFFNDLA